MYNRMGYNRDGYNTIKTGILQFKAKLTSHTSIFAEASVPQQGKIITEARTLTQADSIRERATNASLTTHTGTYGFVQQWRTVEGILLAETSILVEGSRVVQSILYAESILNAEGLRGKFAQTGHYEEQLMPGYGRQGYNSISMPKFIPYILATSYVRFQQSEGRKRTISAELYAESFIYSRISYQVFARTSCVGRSYINAENTRFREDVPLLLEGHSYLTPFEAISYDYVKANLVARSYVLDDSFAYAQAQLFNTASGSIKANNSRGRDGMPSLVAKSLIVRRANTRFRGGIVWIVGHSIAIPVGQPTITDAINSLSRYWYPLVEVYFDGPDKPPVIIKDLNIDSFYLLEELKADSKNILGSISSNQLDLGLANINRQLSPTNKAGPYYGKLLPNVMVKVYLYLRLKEQFTSFPLGTFYTDDWSDASNSTVLNVRCYDRLYTMAAKPFNGTKVIKGISYYDLFKTLFTSMGLASNEFEIDPTLATQKTKYGWIPQGTFGYALQYLAQAANSFIYLNRLNVFTVKQLNVNTPTTARVNDLNQIMSLQIPTSYNTSYAKLAIDVVEPSPGVDEEIILEIKDFLMPNGTITFNNCKFSKTPIDKITKIIVEGKTTNIDYYWSSSDSITMYVNNIGVQEIIYVKVYGTVMSLSTQQYMVEDASIKKITGDKQYQVHNNNIQSYSYAQFIASAIFPIMTNPHANITTQLRGNPRILPGTYVEATDPSDDVDKQKILVYRNKLSFAGGLEQEIQGYNII